MHYKLQKTAIADKLKLSVLMALNREMGLKKLRKDGLSSNIKEYYTSYKY